MISAPSRQAARGREIVLILRFIAVGASGFLVDAGVLILCMNALRLGPIPARFISFGIAVICTFQFNRTWAFRGQSDPGFFKGLPLYLGVQGFGFGCNITIYSILIVMTTPPWNAPLLCLTIASGLAMIINYLGSRLLVFRSSTDI